MSRKLRVSGPPAAVRQVTPLERGSATTDEALFARARERGYAAGLRDGAQEAHAEAARALEAAAEQLEALHARATADLGRTAAELSTAIAQRLLRTEIDAGRYDLETIVRETLHAASAQRSPCVVHLNPQDMELLRDVRFRSGTTLQSDPGVPRGDVQVETTLGLLVRDVDAIVREIGERIAGDLR